MSGRTSLPQAMRGASLATLRFALAFHRLAAARPLFGPAGYHRAEAQRIEQQIAALGAAP